MNNSLFRKTIDEYKKNSLSLVFISIFFCLVVCASLALDYLLPGLSFAAILFLAIPLFFGAIVQSYMLRFNQDLNIKTYFKYSYSYYRPQFYGCFHLISSFLKSFLVEIVISIISTSILYAIFSNNYGADFSDSFTAFMNYFEAGMDDFEYLQEIFGMNDNLLGNFFNVSLMISGSFGMLAFLYFVSFNAIEAMFRSTVRGNAFMFGPKAFAAAIKMNKKAILKDFWKINWPIFVLAIIGSIGGSMASIFGLGDYDLALTIGAAGTFILIIPYFPIYLCSIHAIYEKYQLVIIGSIQQTMSQMLKRFINSPNLSEEQKSEAERLMNEIMKENNEEENKKDPESGS